MSRPFRMHSAPRETWFSDDDVASALECRPALVRALRMSGKLKYRAGQPPMVSGTAVADYVAGRVEEMAERTADLIEGKAEADAAEHAAAWGERGTKAAAVSTNRRRLSELPADRLRQRAAVASERVRAAVSGRAGR